MPKSKIATMLQLQLVPPSFFTCFISQYEAAKIAHAEGHDEEYEFFEKSKHDESRDRQE
jgi:hypothetical protein